MQRAVATVKGMTMKFLSQVLFSVGLFGIVLAGCERHDFEKTKVLHLGHGEGHGEHGEAHGDAAHAGTEDHGKTDKDTAAETSAAPAPSATETPRATGL